MQEFPKSLFCTLRAVVRFVVLGGVVSVSVPASLGNAQIAPDMPNPIVAPNPLTRTLSIFRLNMQDKIGIELATQARPSTTGIANLFLIFLPEFASTHSAQICLDFEGPSFPTALCFVGHLSPGVLQVAIFFTRRAWLNSHRSTGFML
jgi:hypothetical protein